MKELMQNRWKLYLILATLLGAVIGAMPQIITKIEEKREAKLHCLIVMSTKSEQTAIRYCEKLHRHGYTQAKVYLDAGGTYAVSLGKYKSKEVFQVKNEAILKADIRQDSYLLPIDSFVDLIYPKVDQPSLHNFYIVVFSSKTKKIVQSKARDINDNHELDAEVYLTKNGFYAVVIPKPSWGEALSLMEDLKYKGIIRQDSHIITSPGLIQKIDYEKEVQKKLKPRDCYLVVYSTSSFNVAIDISHKIKKKRVNINPEIYLTDNGNYAVTLGKSSYEKAYALKQTLIRQKKIEQDSYLAREGFRKRVY